MVLYKKRIVEATNGLVQKDLKGTMKDCFISESWFVSKRSDEAAMDVGAEIISMFKTNIKLLYK